MELGRVDLALGCEAASSLSCKAVESRDESSTVTESVCPAVESGRLPDATWPKPTEEAVLRRWRELAELEVGRSCGEVSGLEACELRLDSELDEAFAMMAAV